MHIIMSIGKFILGIIYALLKLLPTKNKVLFLSRQANEPSVDILMLNEKIKAMCPEYKIAILCRTLRGPGYIFHMIRQLYHLATAKVVVLDSYCIVVSLFTHKKTLLVIQMWHSVGTMKKFGYSILDRPEGRSSKIANIMHMHEGYDYCLASSAAYISHLADGFNCDPSIIKVYPLPRIELLHNETYANDLKDKILKKYPELENGKTNIVYCPTFRNKSKTFTNAFNDLVEILDFDKYNLIVKLHPLADIPNVYFIDNVNDGFFVFDSTFTSFEMLFVADVIVSDYSCIIYEAAARNIPIYLYAFDYDDYKQQRDIYMDYEDEMPGPICKTASDLTKVIADPYDMDALHSFYNKYVTPKSPHMTEDIVRFIFFHLK